MEKEGYLVRLVSLAGLPTDGDAPPLEIALTPRGVAADANVELTGIGAVLRPRGDVLRIQQVVPNGGAADAGLGPGDAIVAIDGTRVTELGFDRATGAIRGWKAPPSPSASGAATVSWTSWSCASWCGYERLGSATSSRVSGGCRRKRKLSRRDRHHLAAPLRLDAGVSVDVGIAEGVQVGGEMARESRLARSARNTTCSLVRRKHALSPPDLTDMTLAVMRKF